MCAAAYTALHILQHISSHLQIRTELHLAFTVSLLHVAAFARTPTLCKLAVQVVARRSSITCFFVSCCHSQEPHWVCSTSQT